MVATSLVASPAVAPLLIAVDFDGTITTREMLPDFFRRSIPRRRLVLGQVLLALSNGEQV